MTFVCIQMIFIRVRMFAGLVCLSLFKMLGIGVLAGAGIHFFTHIALVLGICKGGIDKLVRIRMTGRKQETFDAKSKTSRCRLTRQKQ